MQYLTFITCLAGVASAAAAAKKTTTTTAPATTSVPATCSATPVPAPAKGVTCGKTGTIAQPAYFGGGFSEVSRDACAAVCATIEGCNSFGYDPDQLTCQLFSETLAQMKFKAKTSNVGYRYYSLGCFGCAPQPTTTSSSSTPSSTTSSSSTPTSSSAPTSSPAPTSAPSSTDSSTTGTSSTDSGSSTPTSTPMSTSFPPITTSFTPSGTLSCSSTAVTVVAGKYTDVYKEYFVGQGVVENPSNPGNKTKAPATYILTDSDACSAITDCATLIDPPSPATYYNSFDVHYDNDNGMWQCTGYYGYNTNPSYFNVVNGSVAVAYGFST